MLLVLAQNCAGLIWFGSGFGTHTETRPNLRGSVRIGFVFQFLSGFFGFNRTLLTPKRSHSPVVPAKSWSEVRYHPATDWMRMLRIGPPIWCDDPVPLTWE